MKMWGGHDWPFRDQLVLIPADDAQHCPHRPVVVMPLGCFLLLRQLWEARAGRKGSLGDCGPPTTSSSWAQRCQNQVPQHRALPASLSQHRGLLLVGAAELICGWGAAPLPELSSVRAKRQDYVC